MPSNAIIAGRSVRLAAAQPFSAKARVVRRLRGDPEARNLHFLRYNIGAATYAPAYARRSREEYLPYLDRWVAKPADGGVAGAGSDIQQEPHRRSST